jgi:hypothetical protein
LIWCIDAGLSAHYGGVTAVLEIAGGTVSTLVDRTSGQAEPTPAARASLAR